jgi:8-oxo-dGTP diphosphatase
MEHSAGCIIFKLTRDGPRYAMMLDKYGKWTFPKGHLEAGEAAFAAARRELEEEIGIKNVELTTRLGETHYKFVQKNIHIAKCVDWFLVQAAADAQLQINLQEQIAAVAWLDFQAALNRLGYPLLKRLFTLADEIVRLCYTSQQ